MKNRRYSLAADPIDQAVAARPAGVPSVAELLDFEARTVGFVSKSELIRKAFGISFNRYHYLLNRALDDPAALEHDAMTTNRLLRLREDRTKLRDARVDR